MRGTVSGNTALSGMFAQSFPLSTSGGFAVSVTLSNVSVSYVVPENRRVAPWWAAGGDYDGEHYSVQVRAGNKISFFRSGSYPLLDGLTMKIKAQLLEAIKIQQAQQAIV